MKEEDHPMKAMLWVPEKYVLDVKIAGLPVTINRSGRLHWAIQARNVRDQKEKVRASIRGFLPRMPLKKAKLTLTRFSASPMDPDNLAISFKSVVDSLVECGVLANDQLENIGMPDYRWEKAERKKGSIRIRVEEVRSGDET
jgi:hypothetical protein